MTKPRFMLVLDAVRAAAARAVDLVEQHQRVRHLAETHALTLLRNVDWRNEDYDAASRESRPPDVADTIETAEAATSLVRGSMPADGTIATQLTPKGGRHHILIDVDNQGAEWVPSSTPGHHHLYVPLGPGVEWERYKEWLEASARIGLIEEGYKEVAIARGYTVLRLPWIVKGEEVECVEEGLCPPAPQPDPWSLDAVF